MAKVQFDEKVQDKGFFGRIGTKIAALFGL
jgi:hypothetical protein